ncbi:hypothetical protein ACFWIB_19955 [Streptomyces sp. NPDC127051]|uniref:hypothetical protein n=1 Tax=Streptomyces sp. NPDC127051 TaxID=3347119 RepID=UPI00364AA72C
MCVEAEGPLGREEPKRTLYVVRKKPELCAEQTSRQSLLWHVVACADPVADGTV